jgi:hypothetical protein
LLLRNEYLAAENRILRGQLKGRGEFGRGAVDDRGGPWWRSAMDGDRKMANASSDGGAAEQSYQEAITVAKGQSAKTLELRAATSLARLREIKASEGEPTICSPPFMVGSPKDSRPYLKDAKALLEELT